MGDTGGEVSRNSSVVPDLKTLVPVMTTSRRRTKAFAYGFVIAFVACTALLAFGPSGSASSPWFNSLFTSSSISTSYRSHFDSVYSYFFPLNSSAPSPETLLRPQSPGNQPRVRAENGGGPLKDGFLEGSNRGTGGNAATSGKNRTGEEAAASPGNGDSVKRGAEDAVSGKKRAEGEAGSPGNGGSAKQRAEEGGGAKKDEVLVRKNETRSGVSPAVGSGGKQTVGSVGEGKNQSVSGVPAVGSTDNGTTPAPPKDQKGKETSSKGNEVPVNDQKNRTAHGAKQSGSLAPSEHKPVAGRGDQLSNFTASLVKGNGSAAPASSRSNGGKREDLIDKMMSCDIFHGNWVRDDSYPLYPEGSCPHIDEPFDCYHNGRPDLVYQKLRWQPHGCNIPRLNATDMLERLRGKRLVFVGDSLNRNMWESLVCVLRHAVKDKNKVFEASGKREFRTQGSYSFLFKDYGCTVEFFRSPFLVQEWEMDGHNGTKKETLRLDVVEGSASKYKDAYIIVFNTGHWWTHEKTSKGRDYYQEGNRVYSELNVDDAFHKALTTWADWVDANVNSKRTHVFFRGYSASHFSGGQWNSGGQCDNETEPIKNEAFLSSYPPMMSILESVINEMKTPVTYLNITRMTDYRKDAHPSIYRMPNMTEEEKAPDQIQDCSHWCLPGVPDSWNELVYAQLLIKQHQMHH